MKILLISTNETAPWGGSEEFWYQAALYWNSKKYKVTLVKKDWAEQNHQKVLDLKTMGIHFVSYQESAEIKLRNVLGIANFNKAILVKGNQLEGIRWMERLSQASIPFYPVFELMTNLQVFSDEKWQQVNQLHKKAHHNYFVSQYSLNLFRKTFLYSEPNCSTILNPIDETASELLPYPKNEIPQLAIVSRLDRFHKGFDTLFEALSLIPKLIQFKLNIYGEGLNSLYCRELKTFYNLKQVEFHGEVNDKRIIWNKNQALVMFSRMEGLPLSMVEAVHCGRTVIANELTGITDLCEFAKDNLYRLEANTAPQLAKELSKIISDCATWEEKGVRARKKILPYFSNARFYKQLDNLIQL